MVAVLPFQHWLAPYTLCALTVYNRMMDVILARAHLKAAWR
jgi:hypothetical protein